MSATSPASRRRGVLGRARSGRGFSLAEMLVASAVFLFVILTAYQVFQRSNESYRLGQNQAEMVQAARSAFDQMTNDVRLAGFEFDVDGEKESYPNQADEPLEFMHRRAIVVRANFDFQKEMKGREPGLEFHDDITMCCPVVTIANDEIIGFGLSNGTTTPGSVVFDADISGTEDDEDTDYRDGYIADNGDLIEEETVTIPNVELRGPGDAGYDPPYTLYRFQLQEDGSILRMPLIDNVYSLEFSYFDESGAEIVGPTVAGTQAIWGGDDGKHDGVGRTERYAARRITVKVETMTPETDLRLKRVSNATGVRNVGGRRLFTLEADMLPPNLGRRGSRDRDINPPEPPRNVTVCTGQCGMVRVAWDPGPPEDKVADHIVTLCSDGPCAADFSNRIGSFIVIANFDAQSMKEYAVFTQEDNPGIAQGEEIWARVIARNVTGTESECPVPDCNVCCQSTSGAVVDERSRPESFPLAYGGGYDPSNASFPDARPANDGGMLIVSDPASAFFPPSLTSRVTLDSPKYALNKAAGAGTAPYDWTTKDLGGGVTAAMSCFVQESTPADATTDLRTPYSALRSDSGRGNTYVWRVSGVAGASPTWGGATSARNFVPTAANLHDFTYLQLQAGSASYPDASSYAFTTTQWGPRYDGYGTNDFKAAGVAQAPIRAVTPCEVYYYRFRATSICWEDKPDLDANPPLPPDGVEDNKTPVVRAWDVPLTVSNPSEYRRLVMGITPFYPPMLNAGDGTGQRDKADQGTHDSDDYASAAAVDTYATPSYTLPQRVTDPITGAITAWIKPEAPSEFYLTRANSDNTAFMKAYGDNTLYDARIIFNAGRRTAPEPGEGDPQPAAFRTFRLYRKEASSATPAASEFDFNTANPTLVATFDSKAPDDVRHYTLEGQDLVPGPETADFTELLEKGSDWAPGSPDFDCSRDPDDVPGGTTCVPYIYWLKTAQCVRLDDGVDTTSAETSAASRPFLFPCALQYDVEDITVDPLAPPTAPSTVTWQPVMRDSNGVLNCSDIRSGRLLAYKLASGDYLGSSDWRTYEDGKAANCDQDVMPNPLVLQAVRGFPGPVRFVVEVSSSVADRDISAATTPIGCRVRSDYGPTSIEAGPAIIDVTACPSAAWCGTDIADASANAGPNIFGHLDDADIELADNNTKMIIHVPVLGACGQDFELRGLELKLVKGGSSGDNTIPNFQSGRIAAGLTTTYDLPDITNPDGTIATDSCELDLGSGFLDAGEDDPGEADVNGSDGVMVLRWRDTFCKKTPDINDDPCACTWSYPTVLGNATELRIELTFAGSLCDVTLQQFNFRVPISDNLDRDGDGEDVGELVCSQRAQRAADLGDPARTDSTLCPDTSPSDGPGGPAGADPDLPEDCELEGGWDTITSLRGQGRGGPALPALACGTCTEDCPQCQCPLENDDGDIAQDSSPDYVLTDDPLNPFWLPFTQLDLVYDQMAGFPDCDSPDCPFTINRIELEYRCTADRDCGTELNPIEPLGKIAEDGTSPLKLIHEDLSEVEIGYPDPLETSQNDPGFKRYVWNGLSVPLTDGEQFTLRFRFDDTIDRGEISLLRIRFSQPFTAECNADGQPGAGFGPNCSNPSNIYLDPFP